MSRATRDQRLQKHKRDHKKIDANYPNTVRSGQCRYNEPFFFLFSSSGIFLSLTPPTRSPIKIGLILMAIGVPAGTVFESFLARLSNCVPNGHLACQQLL